MMDGIDLDELEQEKARTYFAIGKEMFPDVEVTFLEEKCIEFAFDFEGFNKFIEETMLTHNYPKQPFVPVVVYDQNDNWKNFTTRDFIEKFPNPKEYFSSSVAGCNYIPHSITFLEERFRYGSSKVIKNTLKKCNYNLYSAYKKLKKTLKTRKTRRCDSEIEKTGKPPTEFFDEIAFITNEELLNKYMKDRRLEREEKLVKARETGALNSCGCCFSDDLLNEEIVKCSEGHIFCKDCVKKSIEVLLGEGKIDFPCLQDCGVYFENKTLKEVMPRIRYESILRKLQEREILRANIPGLDSCPFCTFSAIPDEASLIFECLNCKKISCRFCHKENHLPLSCSEIDDKNTKIRTYVEERMSKALIRNCFNCGSKFIREDGCNKMICHCGAVMCYVCRKPITGYDHFTDNNNENIPGKCPLWTNNNHLHTLEVDKEAERALQEVKRKNPEIDIEIYKKLRK